MGDHSFAPMNSSDFSTALAGDPPQQELHPASVHAAPGLRFSVFCLLSAANGFPQCPGRQGFWLLPQVRPFFSFPCREVGETDLGGF